ncbi:MAG UNVERIFIED_CONTAM: exodeoxyribonuclease III [Rickettsiaceae bacterium]|jgi:exodeoxyribonuclease-3
MKIACWNVNSIKSRLGHVVDWLEQYSPDLVLFQEIKCETQSFPEDAFMHLGYNHAISGQKTYNGVAIFSKYPIDNVITTFPDNPCELEARFLEISFATLYGYFSVINVYVPNGGEIHSDKFNIKLLFLKALKNYLHQKKSFDHNVIIAGDFNVAPFDIDVYAPHHLQHTTCFTVEERALMRSILNDGWIDLYRTCYPVGEEYTWWDYRARSLEHNNGMRIDMILSSPKIADMVKAFVIHKDVRESDKASDHAPIMALF